MFIEVLSLQHLVYIANFESVVIHIVFMSFVTPYIYHIHGYNRWKDDVIIRWLKNSVEIVCPIKQRKNG